MAIDPKSLQPRYQAQVAEKLLHAARRKGAPVERTKSDSKYKNISDTRNTPDGRQIRFASKKEARRYDELMLMLNAGEIRNLKLQPEYTLQEAYTTPDGERVRRIYYRADFSYQQRAAGDEFHNNTPVQAIIAEGGKISFWKDVVEDVKGRRTDMYKLKKKLMRERLGIEIVET